MDAVSVQDETVVYRYWLTVAEGDNLVHVKLAPGQEKGPNVVRPKVRRRQRQRRQALRQRNRLARRLDGRARARSSSRPTSFPSRIEESCFGLPRTAINRGWIVPAR